MFDFCAFCDYFGVRLAGARERHYRSGWEHTECPLCSAAHSGNHLGWNSTRGYFHCWNCGWHSVTEVVSALARVPMQRARELIGRFQIPGTEGLRQFPDLPADETRAETCQLPDSFPLWQEPQTRLELFAVRRARNYLVIRGFTNPVSLGKLWDLHVTTAFVTPPWRIIAPYTVNGTVVSWQGRDYTGKQEPKYLSQKRELAVLDVKETLYGFDQALPFQHIIITEGIIDAWKLGPGTLATSGTAWTQRQANLIAQFWRRATVFFDQGPDEVQALERSMQLCAALVGLGVETDSVVIDDYSGDPGSLSEESAITLALSIRSSNAEPRSKRQNSE